MNIFRWIIGGFAGLLASGVLALIQCAEIMQGLNPAADKQKAKATAAKDWTVREVVKDYRAKKLVSLGLR